MKNKKLTATKVIAHFNTVLQTPINTTAMQQELHKHDFYSLITIQYCLSLSKMVRRWDSDAKIIKSKHCNNGTRSFRQMSRHLYCFKFWPNLYLKNSTSSLRSRLFETWQGFCHVWCWSFSVYFPFQISRRFILTKYHFFLLYVNVTGNSLIYNFKHCLFTTKV